MTQIDSGPAVLDKARIERFAERLFGTYTESVVTLVLDLAHRTGLLETLGAGAGTSQELAERAGLNERYVREGLGALVTAGIVDYDANRRRYALPAEHAVCLTGPGSLNLAPVASSRPCSRGTCRGSPRPSGTAVACPTASSAPSSPRSWTP